MTGAAGAPVVRVVRRALLRPPLVAKKTWSTPATKLVRYIPSAPRTPSRRRVNDRSPSRENHTSTGARGGPWTASVTVRPAPTVAGAARSSSFRTGPRPVPPSAETADAVRAKYVVGRSAV